MKDSGQRRLPPQLRVTLRHLEFVAALLLPKAQNVPYVNSSSTSGLGSLSSVSNALNLFS